MRFELQPVLEGPTLRLRPLREEDWGELYAAASDPLIWAQHPIADRWREPVFRDYFDGAIRSGGAFAVIDRADGRIVGSTRYHSLDAEKREVEIGYTFLARSHWGGRANAEMKRLMLDHAFRFADSVVFVVGAENRRSQRAVEKIGGVREGTVARNGRDDVLFRIRREEWARRPGMLHLVCGKVAAGKSTLCARLGEAPRTVVISEDFWTKRLFGEEMRDVADYVRVSAKLRAAMGPHVTDLLRAGVDVALDFPANTAATRAFWRDAADAARAPSLLHWLDVPDDVCRARLRQRNAEATHDFAGVTEAQFDLITRYFEPPEEAEGFAIVRES